MDALNRNAASSFPTEAPQIMRISSLVTAAIGILGAATSHAQDILIVGGGNNIVHDTVPTIDPLAGQQLGQQNISSGFKDVTFTILNRDEDTPLIINSVTIGGLNPTNFTVVTPAAGSVAALGSTFFTVRFDPDAAGAREATITVANNDTDAADASYAFLLKGTGTVGAPPAKADLQLSLVQGSMKAKIDKATNKAVVKGKLVVTNPNPAAAAGTAAIQVFASKDEIYDSSDTQVITFALPALPATDPAKSKPSQVPISFTVNTGKTIGHLIFRLDTAIADSDASYVNNTISREFGVTLR